MLVKKVDMFHSETSAEKSDIIKKLQDGDSEIKEVIATSALGMGIDIVNCNFIWYTIFNYKLSLGSRKNWRGWQGVHCIVVIQ